MHHLEVTITYRDDKKETYRSTDFPTIGDNWITLYNNLNRKFIPAQTISRIEYSVRGNDKPTTRSR